jgi:hypothetical protein
MKFSNCRRWVLLATVPFVATSALASDPARVAVNPTSITLSLDPAACAVGLAWAPAVRGIRVKRGPLRLREAERGPG